MSQEKAQLIAPIGIMTVSGMTATGVITATSFTGDVVGSAKSLVNGSNVDVGVMTATSFAGNLTGNIQRLADSAPDISAGVTTATSFVGNLTGSVTDLTSQPAITVGLVTATSLSGPITGNVTGNITGNVTGLAGSITPNSNLGVGVCTAIQYHGDGSGLTGAGSSAYIAQEITASPNASSETIIDLSYGNLIYFDQTTKSTTVGFASTSAAEQITFIRDTGAVTPTFTTGGVTFDGNDSLSVPNSTDLNFGSGDFTVECWVNSDNTGQNNNLVRMWDSSANRRSWAIEISSNKTITFSVNSTGSNPSTNVSGGSLENGQWYHVATVRDGNTLRVFVNGIQVKTSSFSGSLYNNTTDAVLIGDITEGKISNVRIVKGTAVYTTDFDPPFYDLTNITNTKLLCCQSDSSTTAAAVIPTGSITANGDPTAGAQTITSSSSVTASITWPSTVKWNNNTVPTLINSSFPSSFQIFHLTTGDTGASYQAWEEMQEESDNYNLFGTSSIGSRWLNQGSVQYSSPIQVEGNNFKNVFSWSYRAETVFATKNDGTLWGAGENNYGEVGNNSRTDPSSPIQIPGTTWKSGSVSGDVTAATKTNGTLWMWGWNAHGWLGQNDTVAYSSPVQIPGTTWKETANGGGGINGGYKTDGTLWTWGSNEHGQLGLNNRTKYSSPVQLPGTTWNYGASSSGRNQAAIKTDGTLWIWGTNENGQLGQNTNGTPSGSLDGRSSPAQVGTDTTWSNIVWGDYAALARKTDGTLWSWGYAGPGVLAQNNNTPLSSPTQIGTGTDWSNNLAMDKYEGAATKTDGTLWVWGRASGGVLGMNTDEDGGLFISSPIQVGTSTGWSQERNGVTIGGSGLFVLKEF